MENSIEEDIKIIERKIKEAEHYTDITGLCLTLDKELCNAFINILSDYKRVSKENEQLRTEVNSLRKENEELKNKINQLENMNEFQSKDIEKAVDYTFELNKEIEIKDQIIDLMSEMLNNHDIDEDICKQMGQKENCNEFTDKENCKNCIKQYFENKLKK